MLTHGLKLLRRRPSPQMISLDAFTRHVYQYAPPATTEHLRRTVWAPLGLATDGDDASASLHASIYAVPPITTNLRCVGANIESQLRACLQEREQTAAEGAKDASNRYAPMFALDRIGLHFCGCVQPRLSHITTQPPQTSSATSTTAEGSPVVLVVDAGAAEAVLRGSDLYAPGIITASRVFVAGEAALVAFYVERVGGEEGACLGLQEEKQQEAKRLRGEEGGHGGVATAAVAAATEGEEKGVVRQQAGEVGKVPLQLTDAPASTQWRLASSLSAGITLPSELYEPLPLEVSPSELQRRRRLLVCVGQGTVRMGWKEVLGRPTRGVLLRTEWTPQLQPSRATLRRLLNIPSPAPSRSAIAAPPSDAATTAAVVPDDVFFLQNYSSMVPVSLLVDHLPLATPQRPCTSVLDACAAPGGKTSLLLSCLQAQRGGEAEAAEASFRVTCCERSRPRQEQLLALLQRHFSNDNASDSFLGRVLEPHCIDTNKYLKKLLTRDGGLCAFTDTFDAILLDPPCTGLGLRPKLLPHVHTITSIQQSADYQRKLFDSCVRHLHGTPTTPGVLVYSTCTTSLEENEANVLHFLRSYPMLRLARASAPAHEALCALSVTTYTKAAEETVSHASASAPSTSITAPSPQLLLSREILLAQLEREAEAAVPVSRAPLLALRFMPRPLAQYTEVCEDSVGFFVAVFLCDGHSSS